MKPLISVIIPCYNAEKYIHICWQSIYQQSIGFDQLEVIFVDDLSTDSTWSIIQGYADKYPQNVKAIRLEKKGLAGGARNRGIHASTGNYIFFIDADDYIDSSIFEQMYQKSVEYNCDMVQCLWKNTKLDHDTAVIVGEDRFLDLSDDQERGRYICNHYSVDSWGKLYKASFIKENQLYFKENLFFENIYFTFLTFFYLQSVYFINARLYFYRENENSIMHYSYNVEQESHYIKTAEYIEEALKERGLYELVQEKYWNQYQYYITCKSFLDPIYRIFSFYDRQTAYFTDHLNKRFPNAIKNPRLTNVDDDLVKRRASLLREKDRMMVSNLYHILKKESYNRYIDQGKSNLSAVRAVNNMDTGNSPAEEASLIQAATLEQYFQQIREQGLFVVLSGKDECSRHFPAFLQQAKLTASPLPEYRASFIALTDGFTFQHIDVSKGLLEYQTKLMLTSNGWSIGKGGIIIPSLSIKIASLGFQPYRYSYSSIMIDNIEYSCNGRGLNGVVINREGTIVDVWSIDTFADSQLRFRRNNII